MWKKRGYWLTSLLPTHTNSFVCFLMMHPATHGTISHMREIPIRQKGQQKKENKKKEKNRGKKKTTKKNKGKKGRRRRTQHTHNHEWAKRTPSPLSREKGEGRSPPNRETRTKCSISLLHLETPPQYSPFSGETRGGPPRLQYSGLWFPPWHFSQRLWFPHAL